VGWQRALDCRLIGTFERFTTKTHFNTFKRLVLLVGLAVLAVKLAVTVLWAAPAGSPLDLLARLAASTADLGAVLLVFEVLRSRRPANRAARSAVPAAGRGAALGLATWAVLAVWLGLGWRTVAVECRRWPDRGPGTSPSRRFASLPK
jgi:hypothetical protein